MQTAPGRAALFPPPMLVTLAVLLSTPLWLAKAGLYQYLALEIMIWMLFALGYNLLLGYTGLPSFGHGAFFGIGAYAFGLLQQRLWANLWFDLVGAMVVAALLGAAVALFISHRRGIYYALLTIAFGQVFWFLSIKWHGLTGGEDRRLFPGCPTGHAELTRVITLMEREDGKQPRPGGRVAERARHLLREGCVTECRERGEARAA